MLAVDTNVLIRLLMGDDKRQSPQAVHLFDANEIFISKTVFLETEWVLRRLYGIDRPTIVKILQDLLDATNAYCEDEDQAHQALSWAMGGMDLADAMHLASSSRCERFATFDRAFIKAARKADTTPPVAKP